jgi:hypothetical protein
MAFAHLPDLLPWTGNRPDAEDATTWVLRNVAARTRLPELVNTVNDRVADATLEAVGRHGPTDVASGDSGFLRSLRSRSPSQGGRP